MVREYRACPICETGALLYRPTGIAAYCPVCDRIHGPLELARGIQKRLEAKRARLNGGARS